MSKNLTQEQIIKQQDKDLEELSKVVKRLGVIGMTIDNELSAQNQTFSNIEKDVNSASSTLSKLKLKIKKLIHG